MSSDKPAGIAMLDSERRSVGVVALIAMIRMFGLFALERVLGRRLTDADYTPTAPPPTRREQVRKLLEHYSSP